MIEILKESDKKKFFMFLNSYWKKDHIYVKSELLFDYHHKINDRYNFIISKNEQTITSILGYIPSDKDGKHLWLVIWKSKLQGMEGISLLFKLLSNKPVFIGALGISSVAKKIYIGLGWESGILSHYYLSINQKINLRLYTPNDIKIDFLFSSEFIFDRRQDWCLPKKDKHYYEKRYLEHPVFKYFFLTILNNELTFIGRIIEYNCIKVFHVVDVKGDLNGKNISEPISWFLENEGFDLFEMMIFDSRGVSTDLFLKYNTEIIPTYFSPFVYRNIQMELCYKKSKDLPVRFFLGDSDQDRPNK